MILSSNKTFSAWAEIFGDPVAVAAMVDRLVHHAGVLVLKGDSYRLKARERRSWVQNRPGECPVFNRRILFSFRPTLTNDRDVARHDDAEIGSGGRLEGDLVPKDKVCCTFAACRSRGLGFTHELPSPNPPALAF